MLQLQSHLIVSTTLLPFNMSLSPMSNSVSSIEWEYEMSYSSLSTISQEYTIKEHAQTDEEAILPLLQFPMIATQSPSIYCGTEYIYIYMYQFSKLPNLVSPITELTLWLDLY